MLFGGVPIRRIAERVSTPFYAYSGDRIRTTVRAVRSALGPKTELYFSIKSNPSLAICQLMAHEAVGAELASVGELLLAQRAGFPPDRTIFAGPGKTDDELERALMWGIASINVESPGELQRLSAIAERLKRPARVCLRVNPEAQVKGAQMRMGGGPSQFGIDEALAGTVAESVRHHPYVRVVGVHVYVGSQLFDIDALLRHCNDVVGIAERVAASAGSALEMLDFGGGFAVPYFENSVEFALSEFASGFQSTVNRCEQSPALAGARLIVELGRYLVADAGVYVTRVVDVKTSRGTTYVVTDGGMNHHITATGNFGQVFRKPYPLAVLNRMTAPAEGVVNIVGPCCTPLDVIGQKVALCHVEVGDLLGIFYSGAYGYSASSLGFLSHPTPAEVMVLGSKLHILREPGPPDAVVSGQSALDPSAL